jgi:hypothetical protein
MHRDFSLSVKKEKKELTGAVLDGCSRNSLLSLGRICAAEVLAALLI